MDTSDLAQVTRSFVAAIAAPNPAAGLLHSLPLGLRFIQAPAARSPRSLPLGPHFAQGLTTDSCRVFVGPRYDQVPAAASPHGVPTGYRFVQDQGPAAAPPHGVPTGHHFVQDQDPAAAPPHGAPVGQRTVRDQDPAATSLHRVPAGPHFVQDLVVNSPCSVSVGHISTFDYVHRRIAFQLREIRRGHWRSSRFGLQATRYLPIVHLGCIGFDLSSCLVRPDIFSDPASLRHCSWNSPYSCGLRIWPSAPGYRSFKTTISPAPPTYSWVQAGRQ